MIRTSPEEYFNKLLGFFTGRTMGGFVHVLLVLAVVLGLIAMVRGKNP